MAGDSGKPYNANEAREVMIDSAASAVTALRSSATRGFAFIRSRCSVDRVNPIARRNSSASEAVKRPNSIASLRICS